MLDQLMLELAGDGGVVEIAHRRAVGEEDEIEPARLRQPDAVLEVGELHIAGGWHIRVTPGGVVVAEVGYG